MAAREALTARRKALGLTQETLAEALRVERSTVARWEQGTATPRPWYRRQLADALGLAPDELAPLLEDDLLTQSGPEAPGPIGSWSAGPVTASQRDQDIDADYIETVRADARRLIDLDTSYGGDDVTRLAVRAFRSAYERLASGLYVPNTEHDLQAAVGELGQVAGWIAYDADQQRLSRQLTNEALLHSRLAGDRTMELFELGQLAMQAVHLGRPAEALRIADEVIDSQPPSSRVAAVFRIRRARALGQAGDCARALREHDLADAILTGGAAAADPGWTWWVDEAELAWHRAMTLAALGRRSSALELFQTAHELRPPGAHRARYNDLAHLLDAQVAAGNWDDADTSLIGLHAGIGEVSSSRTAALLRRVARQIRQDTSAPSSLTDSAHELSRLLDVSS